MVWLFSHERQCFSGRTYLIGLAALTLVVAVLSGPLTARPRAEDLQIQTAFGFGGFYKIQTPSPLIFTVTNTGQMFEGYALAALETWIPPTYMKKALAVPPGGSSRVEMNCYGCYSQGECSFPLELYTNDGDLLKTQPVRSYVLGLEDTLLVQLGERSGSLDSLRTGDNPGFLNAVGKGLIPGNALMTYPPRIFPVIITEEELPTDPLMYDSASAITMSLSTFLSLSDKTRDVLLAYVLHGGNLIVYHREDDPDEGWQDSPLLPAIPMNGRITLSAESIFQEAEKEIPRELMAAITSPFTTDFERGQHGEVIPKPDSADSAPTPETSGSLPGSYEVVAVSPDPADEVFLVDGRPLVCVRVLGSGHAGFVAFDPFLGNPTAIDTPIALLASYRLLDPYCPTVRTSQDNLSQLPLATDTQGKIFFGRPQASGSNWFTSWARAMGLPVLIYLLGLPFLAFLARGRGRVGIALFIGWSIVMTTVTMYKRSLPVADKASIREADMIWCQALPPDQAEYSNVGSAIVTAFFSYTAQTPAPRSISFDAPGIMIDEFVESNTWPYRSVSIEEGTIARLPDLPIETSAAGQLGQGVRTFILRGAYDQLSATGYLEISPSAAHLKLNTRLPFPAVWSRLNVNSQNLWVSREFGPLDGDVNLETDLVEGDEVSRRRDLFPGFEGNQRTSSAESGDESLPEGMSELLKTVARSITSKSVSQDQKYTTSNDGTRPGRAYFLLAANQSPTGVSVDRGELDREALTVIVISLPIVYKEESR
jgi:hypothetical protein